MGKLRLRKDKELSRSHKPNISWFSGNSHSLFYFLFFLFCYLWAYLRWWPRPGPFWGICWLPSVLPLHAGGAALNCINLSWAAYCIYFNRGNSLLQEQKLKFSMTLSLGLAVYFSKGFGQDERHVMKNSVEQAWLPEVKWKAEPFLLANSHSCCKESVI